MSKKQAGNVRSHDEERQWLIALGNGNIIEGVRSLIEKTKGEQRWEKSNYSRKSRRK